MLKVLGGFVLGVVATVLVMAAVAGGLMFQERESPYGLEETVARIQHNIQGAGNGWSLIGLRNAARPIEAEGGNVLPVMMIEACSTRYSKPILKDDDLRFLSILMPCKISVYKKNDGKIYIGTMNAGLLGRLFGPMVGSIMSEVAADQQRFLEFDPNLPPPPMIKDKPASGGGEGGAGGGGC